MSNAQINKEREFLKMLSEINTLINGRITEYTKSQDKNGLLRHLHAGPFRVKLQPTYAEAFYCPQSIVEIISKYDYFYYFTVEKNQAGIETPVMNIYSAS